MHRFLLTASCLMLGLASPAAADTVTAAHTIRSGSVITASDVTVVTDKTIPGTLSSVEAAIGQEARVILYAGRPIGDRDIGPPALVERNDIVPLVFQHGSLEIAAEGRALGRAGVGDRLRVMNLSSRSTVTGRVGEDGRVTVGPSR